MTEAVPPNSSRPVSARTEQQFPQAAAAGSPAADSSLYLALFNLLPTSVVLLDLAGYVRDVNPAFCRWMGFSREEVVGSHVERFSADDPAKIQANLMRLRSGETLDHEVINRQKDGAIRYYEIRERAVELPDGTRGILVVAHDITDRRIAETERLELERNLLRTQKLESLGVLAGGIAHDFNNLLTVVLGHLDRAMQACGDSAEIRDSLLQTTVAAKRAAELTRQMLAYSGRGRFVVQRVHLDTLLADAVKSVQQSSPRPVDVQIVRAATDLVLEADSVQIVQVLKNLLQNALESLPPTGGSIVVTMAETRVEVAHLPGNRTDLSVVPGRYLAVTIADTGVGMAEDVRQRMFEPFFSTKFAGRGLGLAAVLGIVRGHGGAMFVESRLGHGTTVRVLLPAPAALRATGGDEVQAPVRAAAPRAVGRRYGGKVLYVEDDDAVRDVVGRLLLGLGLDVTALGSGEQAVEAFAAAPGTFAFALLDLTLPGISGVETMARLRRLRPDFAAILTSGYQRETISGSLGEAGFLEFLPKPCDSAVFKQVVAEVCERLQLPRVGP